MFDQQLNPIAEENPNHPIQGPSSSATLAHLLFSKSERATYDKLRTKYTSLRNNKKPEKAASPRLLPPGISTSASELPCLPLALPQISPEVIAPVLRALPTTPEIFNVPPIVLLNIIDAYNLATTAEPSLQALDAAAAILGLIPEPHVQLTSHVTSVVAAIGQEQVSKARGNVLLERVNAEILGSTGWKVETVKGKELVRVLGVEILPVMPALADHEVPNPGSNGCIDEAHPEAHGKIRMTSAECRVQALVSTGMIAPVNFDVPAPPEQTKKIQRFLAKEQGKEFEEYRKGQQKKREKKQKRRQQGEAKLVGNPEELEAALRKEHRKEEERERKKMEKLTWLVFRKMG